MKRNDLKQQLIYPFTLIYTKKYLMSYVILCWWKMYSPVFSQAMMHFFQLIQEELKGVCCDKEAEECSPHMETHLILHFIINIQNKLI